MELRMQATDGGFSQVQMGKKIPHTRSKVKIPTEYHSLSQKTATYKIMILYRINLPDKKKLFT